MIIGDQAFSDLMPTIRSHLIEKRIGLSLTSFPFDSFDRIPGLKVFLGLYIKTNYILKSFMSIIRVIK